MTGREVWRKMTLFWGTLFGINFAMGVATGIVMEFQFGMNWSYYSHYVGDVFGAPLAIEGLMAFFLEATFVGLFFFGWDRLPKVGHLVVTWLVGIGANFSALWILIANGWMQNPVGSALNPDTMRMEVNDFMAVVFNPVAQAKFVHTVSAGYVTGSVFVLAISALFLLQKRHRGYRHPLHRGRGELRPGRGLVSRRARRRERLSDHRAPEDEARRHGEHGRDRASCPASFTLFAIPTGNGQTLEVKIPWVLGLISTRSLDTEVAGHLRAGARRRGPHPQWPRRLQRPRRHQGQYPMTPRPAPPSPPIPRISATRCC